MTDNVINNESLEAMELGTDLEDVDLHASMDKRKKLAQKKAAENSRVLRIRISCNVKAMLVRILALFCLLMLGLYAYTFNFVTDMLDSAPISVIEDSVFNRGGTDTFIVGEALLSGNQRIEDLGVIQQLSMEQNYNNVLNFLSALAVNNPPDLFATLVNPTVDNALLERTSVGDLPKVSDDGRTSLITYARPFNDRNSLSEISIIVNNLGTSESLAEAAIKLRPEISLAFSPYAERMEELVVAARKAGHEVFLELPMEPDNFPVRDPGPFALRTASTLAENISQLEWVLSRAQGYTGLINFQGEAMLQDKVFVSTIMPIILQRGLMFVEKTEGSREIIPRDTINPIVQEVLEEEGHYYTHIDISITINDDEISLTEKLERALEISRQTGRVTIAVNPFPLFLMKIALWASELPEDEFVLTPLSSKAQIHEAQRLGMAG